jgi:uncharacterized protein (TIGR02147 family)
MERILNIFEYLDYRRFIRDWLKSQKKAKRSNLSKLAAAISVHSTFLSHVLNSTKDLSLEQGILIADHVGFTKLENEYFLCLIQWDRAGNQRLKKHWLERLEEIKQTKNKLSQRFEKHTELSSEQKATFYSSWIFTAVWAATAIDEGQTLADLVKTLATTRNQMFEILNFLTQTGLCTEEKGVFKMGDRHIHLPNESPQAVRHHTNWRLKAMHEMDDRSPDELFFTAPMSIARKDFDSVREKINFAIKEIVEIAKASDAEEVVCLNIDFFRCSGDQ